MNEEMFVKILREQVKPAIGCTEPVAVALAVSKAYKEVNGEVEEVLVKLSPNIFKNGMRVGIPGTKETGIIFAVALSIVCGAPELNLEVFKFVTEESIYKAKEIVKKDIIKVEIEDNKGNFYIEAKIKTTNGNALCIIRDYHTNIVYLKVNDKVKIEKEAVISKNDKVDINKLGDLTINEIVNIIEKIPYENIKFLLEGSKMNLEAANKGLNESYGMGLGAGMNSLIKDGFINNDIVYKVRTYTAAAADVRMSGAMVPIMSSAGSGNHGITAIIGPSIVAKELGASDEKLAKALALSHIITIYVKEFTGKLSPICGCSIAAGLGASSSIAYLFGCSADQISNAIKNMIGNLAGVLCDGAKGGCALKLSTASSEAVLSAKLAKNNVVINNLDGIVGNSGETTIKNLGRLCSEGMKHIDKHIIDIMINQ